MHGRIKTRTTEEQEKIKKQEREKKVEAYKKSMGMLIEMRKSGSYEKSALEITCGMLQKNPDIITLWNYRREIFLFMKEELNKEDYQKLLQGDLSLTEQCLRANPKSYGSWHHRVWVLCNMPEPNWERELLLCKRYLELDERNFHCWDYRRFIVQMSNVSDISEYEYTLEKIKVNFSNYSAWHLRSKLLPKIYPDIGNNLPINEAKHKEELELVQNAAFTDPNDQSAWFYQRWLLGLTEPKTHFVGVQAVGNKIIVAVSKSLIQNSNPKCGCFIKLEVNKEEVAGVWKSTTFTPQSSVWIVNLEFNLSESDQVVLHLEENGVVNDQIHLTKLNYIQGEPNFRGTFSPSLKEVLADELTSCKQLLELEPESKWTTLTSLLLMDALDSFHYEKEIENGFQTLIKIDPLRTGYYQDLSSKFTIEHAIRSYYSKINLGDPNELSQAKFVLSRKNLTCLYHMQYLILLQVVDLSCNSLNSKSLIGLHCLLNCERLNLESNKIETLKFLPLLPKLSCLRVCNNPLKDCAVEYLRSFPQLKVLKL